MTEPIGAIREVFAVADLRRLILGNAISMTGFWAYSIAVSVYAFDIGGATLVGIAVVIRLIPSAILAPFMALLADRYCRRSVLLWGNLTQAIFIVAAAAAIWQEFPPAVVFSLATVVTVITSAYEPAKNAMLPDLVKRPDQLTHSNVAMSALESAGSFIGPAIGGSVLALAGTEAAFLTAAVFQMVTQVLFFRITRREDRPAMEEMRTDGSKQAGGNDLLAVLGGFSTVGRDPAIRFMVALTAVQFLVFGMLSVLTVSVAMDELGIGEAGVGYLNAAIGVGGVLGAVVAVSLTGNRGLGKVLVIGLVGWGLPIALIGASPLLVVALLAMTVIGIANTVVDASTNTLLQRIIPEELRGRVYGVLESVIVLAIAAGSLLAPALVGMLDIRMALIATGLILPAVALLSQPGLRRLDRRFEPPLRRPEVLGSIEILAPFVPATFECLASSLRPAADRDCRSLTDSTFLALGREESLNLVSTEAAERVIASRLGPPAG